MTATSRDQREGQGGTSGDMPEEFAPRHLLRRLVALLVFVGLVAVAVGSLPGLGHLRQRFAAADGWLLAVVGLMKLGSCLSNVIAFRDVFCPRMSWRFSYDLAMAEQGTNVLVPTGGAGGLALGAWALRQGGVPTEHIARRSVAFFVLTSIPNFAVAAVLGPLLLTGLFSGQIPTAVTIVFSSLAWGVSIAVAALPLWLGRIDRHKESGRIAGKLRAAAGALDSGIRDTGRLIAEKRWRAILGAFGYLFFDIGALIIGYAAFGGGFPLGPLVFAYVIGQLGGLIPLPAGIGGTDGGLIGALVLFGSPFSQAAAAVLAYRLFQLGVPAALGSVAFISMRRRLTGSAAPAVDCAPLSAS
ncbi:MAG TPA: lysylphosphatidylglycerol synthase transmembrane domain-containing protein [Solirubrobacteraceae bacterium]|nr:lysylphosphatidylglycerol synthase transmembrane domain-containing protein [Solirubrobacteraceae bacterium]